MPSHLLALAVETVPRALGLCDRDPTSITAGCCDRNYWHYRLFDTPNARFQEAGLLFALAYCTTAPGNLFAGKAKMKDWARLVWRYWLRRRNTDGSCAEVYPNERSFCATSFSAAAFVETVRLLGGADAWGTELSAARETMRWLADNVSYDAANQVAASLLALRGYSILTGDRSIAAAAGQRQEGMLRMQWPDGTFPEYGGLDIGYQTITMSTLMAAAKLQSGESGLLDALRKALMPVEQGIAADGNVNSPANSRSTQYLYPYALTALGSGAVERVLRGIEGMTVLRPTWLDDRYCHAMAADYFLAYREHQHVDDAASNDRTAAV